MAEPGFDRARFDARLVTRRLGRALLVLERTGSTNDDVWQALAAGAPDGFTVVAGDQTRGRGRAGRAWHTGAGKGLALSALVRGRGRSAIGVTSLLAGLALVRGLERLGVAADLKWPNDVLLRGRKLAGLLVESRSVESSGDGRAVVIGAGINVAHDTEDFPAELRATATSLAREGCGHTREELAAAFLNALEPLWDEFESTGPGPVLAACRSRGSFWGRTVRVLGPGGPLTGIAQGLDDEGRLLVAVDGGRTATVVAGDVEIVGGASLGAVPGAAAER